MRRCRARPGAPTCAASPPVQPILPATDSIAAHCDGYWSLASTPMRTARSKTSGENFGDFLIMAPFSIDGASSKSGAVNPAVPKAAVLAELLTSGELSTPRYGPRGKLSVA